MRRPVAVVVGVVAAMAVGGATGAWLFAGRVTMCADGPDGGFCEDQVHLSLPGAVGGAVALGLMALAIVAVALRRPHR